MPDFVSFNNQIIPARDTLVSAISTAALNGKGIFTTIAIYNEKPFLWDKHWQRIEAHSEKLKIDISEFSESLINQSLEEIIRKTQISNGRARITFFDESPNPIWQLESDRKTSLLITTGGLRPVPENFRLTIAPYRVNSRSPLAGVKSCNYLENLMTLDEAKSRGFDEALRLNECGQITSAAMANIFWLTPDVLYTPSLKTGCLSGTTREFVLENLACREVEVSLDEINKADAIFLTSAGIGIKSVAEYNGRNMPHTPHPITELITNNC